MEYEKYISVFQDLFQFYLYPLAPIILIIGAMSYYGASFYHEKSHYLSCTLTKRRMERVERSLIAYFRENNRLPCPASASAFSTGQETISEGGTCATYFGVIPYKTVHLQKR